MKTSATNTISARAYTLRELMVAKAARGIRNGEMVFVGMRLPMLAFAVAKRTHAPGAIGLFENGVIRETPARELLYTMADPPNIRGATLTGTMLDVMGFLEQGRVNVGFLGAAEVDRFGNLNTTLVRSEGRNTRLPGSGGACDIACMAQRTVVILQHSKTRLVERVSYVTSPGFGTGGGGREAYWNWRTSQGLRMHTGPGLVVTTMGVLVFDGDTGEAFLASVHPGVRVEDVVNNTGWPLKVSPPVRETEPPTPEELAAIREMDPDGFWTGN
jgi:glutaconate CoA-transferase, subunit B